MAGQDKQYEHCVARTEATSPVHAPRGFGSWHTRITKRAGQDKQHEYYVATCEATSTRTYCTGTCTVFKYMNHVDYPQPWRLPAWRLPPWRLPAATVVKSHKQYMHQTAYYTRDVSTTGYHEGQDKPRAPRKLVNACTSRAVNLFRRNVVATQKGHLGRQLTSPRRRICRHHHLPSPPCNSPATTANNMLMDHPFPRPLPVGRHVFKNMTRCVVLDAERLNHHVDLQSEA